MKVTGPAHDTTCPIGTYANRDIDGFTEIWRARYATCIEHGFPELARFEVFDEAAGSVSAGRTSGARSAVERPVSR